MRPNTWGGVPGQGPSERTLRVGTAGDEHHDCQNREPLAQGGPAGGYFARHVDQDQEVEAKGGILAQEFLPPREGTLSLHFFQGVQGVSATLARHLVHDVEPQVPARAAAAIRIPFPGQEQVARGVQELLHGFAQNLARRRVLSHALGLHLEDTGGIHVDDA